MYANYLFVFLDSFLIGILFLLLLKRFALKCNILIAKNIPLIGGIAIGLSFILTSLLSFSIYRIFLDGRILAILVSSLLMLIFGVIDDYKEMSIFAKFAVQIIATMLLIFFGVKAQIVSIGNFLNLIITFIWVLGITNAFNHLDVMDGLSATVSFICSASLFIICFINGDVKMAILLAALAAASLGFLLYNFPPAKIYMGNSGSHFLGFVLAAITLAISYAPITRKVALFAPLLILGVPIFDTAFLILLRLMKKKLPFRKSNDHLALRLLSMGYSKRKALFIMLALSIFFSTAAVMVSQVANKLGFLIIGYVIFIILCLTVKIGRIRMDG